MATFVADSIKYGIDEDGAGVHDVIGELLNLITTKTALLSQSGAGLCCRYRIICMTTINYG